MKKIKISIDDLIVVLENMKEELDTREIIFFEYNNYPAIADANEPDSVITFQSVNDKGELNEDSDEQVH